jgi:hypothetical protein
MIFSRMRCLPFHRRAAFTLVEVLITCMLTVVVGAVLYSTMRTGSVLSTKNMALNRSHDELRSALDRLANNLRMARNVPTLINTAGAVVASGPAAGLRYDRIIGEPYALDPVMGAGSISSTATSLSVYRSTTAAGAPPVPQVNDVLILDTPNGSARARITGVNTQGGSGGSQRITLTFASAIGKDLTWMANQPQWARLVRQEAFIVMPANGCNELRYYSSFEPVPALNDKTKYAVITNNVGTATGEGTPFNILDVNGDKVVEAKIGFLAQEYNRWLANKEQNNANTYFRMSLALTSRLRPKTTN